MDGGQQGQPGFSARLDDFLCFSIYAAEHAFSRAYKPLLAEIGLTYPQYLAMTLLWGEDDQTVGQLSQRLSLESSTLTPLLKRLEADGLLSRHRDTKDERVVRVKLTPAGDKLRQKAQNIPACILQATGMSLEELGALREQILALTKRLQTAAGGD
ncbi:MarR family winged helix-turn-helix transcriptional regulator [Acidocella facilis]|uniref:MarR family winged helix-turn-helix transcriptional regulator n=1 Tax=Acidocella facilis TaxID=525 RepID=UPI001F444DD1|nr:MarR family transcriptional regulator [Acidocella facilis]